MTNGARSCWCGQTRLEPFSEHYGRCPRCETLVSTYTHDHDVSHVADESASLYGREYWFSHMAREGLLDIYARARADLAERALHWLQTLVKYRTPPGRVLELGSAHGAFVALLNWSGFDATGLELSPAIAAIARELFDVPMLEGPIEDQPLAPASFDAIVLLDVVEHLPDPVRTVRAAVRLLAPGGFLLIQTPRYPEGSSIADLDQQGSRFPEMLKEREHLYLFSAGSMSRLLAEAGCPHLSFEPAIYSHYDMFFAAAPQPLVPLTIGGGESPVAKTPVGRLVQAALDVFTRLQESEARYHDADRDRRTRLLRMTELGERLAEADADRQDRLRAIDQLTAMVKTSEAQRTKQHEELEVLRKHVADLTAALAVRTTG